MTELTCDRFMLTNSECCLGLMNVGGGQASSFSTAMWRLEGGRQLTASALTVSNVSSFHKLGLNSTSNCIFSDEKIRYYKSENVCSRLNKSLPTLKTKEEILEFEKQCETKGSHWVYAEL